MHIYVKMWKKGIKRWKARKWYDDEQPWSHRCLLMAKGEKEKRCAEWQICLLAFSFLWITYSDAVSVKELSRVSSFVKLLSTLTLLSPTYFFVFAFFRCTQNVIIIMVADMMMMVVLKDLFFEWNKLSTKRVGLSVQLSWSICGRFPFYKEKNMGRIKVLTAAECIASRTQKTFIPYFFLPVCFAEKIIHFV